MWEGLAFGEPNFSGSSQGLGFTGTTGAWMGGWGLGEDRDPTMQTLGVHSLPPFCQGKFLINGV